MANFMNLFQYNGFYGMISTLGLPINLRLHLLPVQRSIHNL